MARQPRGVPVGGQFAKHEHAEVDISLTEGTDVATLDRPELSATVERILADHPDEAIVGETVELEGTYYNPTLPVTAGVRDHDAVLAFKSGQCHALALAMHERTGWPIVSVGAEECCYDEDCPDDDDSDGVCSCQIQHLAVQRPDGHLVDIEGPKPEEDFMEAQGDPDWTIKPVPDDRLEDIVRWDDSWRRPNVAVARTFVDEALTEYDPFDD